MYDVIVVYGCANLLALLAMRGITNATATSCGIWIHKVSGVIIPQRFERGKSTLNQKAEQATHVTPESAKDAESV